MESWIMIDPPLDHWIWLIPAVLIGACIGSFLNVVIYRVPLGMSVNKPSRSFCPICKTQLTHFPNFPVGRWVFLRGKCAHC
ncbi:MAG: prepilin peptidase [Akkermansiaceae bacterium]